MSKIIIEVDRIVITGDGPAPDEFQIGAAIQAELQQALQSADWIDGLATKNVGLAVVTPSSTQSELAANVTRGIINALRQ